MTELLAPPSFYLAFLVLFANYMLNYKKPTESNIFITTAELSMIIAFCVCYIIIIAKPLSVILGDTDTLLFDKVFMVSSIVIYSAILVAGLMINKIKPTRSLSED